jgi:hypothetical protein
MYYLLKPDATVLWSDASEFMIQRLQKDHSEVDIDLGRLDWQPAERWFDAGLLNTALRYGIEVADGIVVSGQALVPLDYFRSMEATQGGSARLAQRGARRHVRGDDAGLEAEHQRTGRPGA